MFDGGAFKKAFYERAARLIHGYRKKKGLSGEVFGERIGIGKSTVTGYEQGKIQIPGHTLYLISKELDFEFAEFDPNIPAASEIIRKIAEFKRKRPQNTSGADNRIGFVQRDGFDVGHISSPSPAPVRLRTEHREFLDEYFSEADPIKRKSLELLNSMIRQYYYFQDMSRSYRALMDRSLDVIFEDKDKSRQKIIVEIRQKYGV